jgi:Tfp pilus assembly protein PilO
MSRFTVIIICLLLALIIGFFAYPKYQELNLLKNQIKGKKQEFQFREEYLDELSKASSELKKYEEQLKIIDAGLPSESSLPILFDFFQKISSQSGLILKDMSASEGSASNNIKQITFSLGLNGTYSSFKDLFVLLEKSARMININSFSFSKSGEGLSEDGSAEIFNFNLAVSIHSY